MIYASLGYAQSFATHDSAVVIPKLNIAVPDVPAFSSLGVNPSSILRPSDIKDISSAVSNFIGTNNSFVIPKSFALEVTPGRLSPQNFNLHKYANDDVYRFMHRIRFSAATSAVDDDSSARKISAGIRFTLIDEGDYLADTAFINTFQKHSVQQKKTNQILRKEIHEKYHVPITSIDISFYRAHIDSFESVYPGIKMMLDSSKKYVWDSVKAETLKREFKKNNWNATRLEVAFSPVLSSMDNKGNGAFTSGYYMWIVYAMKVGNFAQWLLGGTYTAGRNADSVNFRSTYSFSTRLYSGANRIKGYAELQFTYKDLLMYKNIELYPVQQSLLFNGGVELNVTDGIWADVSAGYNKSADVNTGTKANLVTNVKFHFTLPEKFNFSK